MESHPCIVVGVVPGQPATVVETAAMFARQLGAELICASVDPSRTTIEERPDGSVVTIPIDPDLPFEEVQVFDAKLRTQISQILDTHHIKWSVRALAGGPAQALARLADSVDALMIIVGTREAGLRGSFHEFFNGSVAVQLAHRQHRPLLVIPLKPVTGAEQLPWIQE